jgi:hypothetical protein
MAAAAVRYSLARAKQAFQLARLCVGCVTSTQQLMQIIQARKLSDWGAFAKTSHHLHWVSASRDTH